MSDIPELDDLNGPVPASPAQLAQVVDRLVTAVRRLREINADVRDAAETLSKTVERQAVEINELNKFKAEVKLGGKLAGWMATGTLALVGAIATFFSGFGTRLFTGGH